MKQTDERCYESKDDSSQLQNQQIYFTSFSFCRKLEISKQLNKNTSLNLSDVTWLLCMSYVKYKKLKE